jgi:hypothetical protein
MSLTGRSFYSICQTRIFKFVLTFIILIWYALLQLEKLSQQLQTAQKDLEAARSAEATARSKAAAEAKQRATQKAEADAAAANMRSEHAAELARLAANRKKLEVSKSCIAIFPAANSASRPSLTSPTSSMYPLLANS